IKLLFPFAMDGQSPQCYALSHPEFSWDSADSRSRPFSIFFSPIPRCPSTPDSPTNDGIGNACYTAPGNPDPARVEGGDDDDGVRRSSVVRRASMRLRAVPIAAAGEIDRTGRRGCRDGVVLLSNAVYRRQRVLDLDRGI